MHIKRYTIAAFLLIAFTGWYVSTFVTSETISVNLLGIEIAPLSVSIWIMIPLFILYIASVIHMSFYSLIGSLNIRKYEKDYSAMIECISDAYLGKEDRNHSFKTSKYKLLGSLLDNTTLFPSIAKGAYIDDERIAMTINMIQDIKEGKVVDLRKATLSIDNPLVVQNERNRYKNEEQSAEEFLSHPTKYNQVLLSDIYREAVKVATVKTIDKYKVFMSKEALFEVLQRSKSEDHRLELENELLMDLFSTLELSIEDYLKITKILRQGIIPEQRIKLFEGLSDINDDAMEAYLYTLYDLEMIAPADAILEISLPNEYLNYKAYRALKESNKNFDINLFVTDRTC